MTRLSIGIKALDEERHIAATLAAAVDAARPFDGEVILADSGSNDNTVEIAKRFGVTVVQLADPAERCCGAGAQLAFQHSTGEFFFVLDGDMVLDRSFVPAAIRFLEDHPEIAAVGGHVREMNTQGLEYRIRAKAAARDRGLGTVDRLDGGGLYRRAAIQDVRYFADRNLHSFEEFDLAARLRRRGWKLARIDEVAVYHYGHVVGSYSLLWRRLRSGYLAGIGELLRGSMGCDHQTLILREFAHIRYIGFIVAWYVLLAMALVFTGGTWTKVVAVSVVALAPLVVFAVRRRSLKLGFYSLVSWNFSVIGLIKGLFHRRVHPQKPLTSVVLWTPDLDLGRQAPMQWS